MKKRKEPAASTQECPDHESIFTGGPAVVFKWRAAEGWPVEYVSPNVSQYGYSPEELLSGTVLYENIVHPEDRARVALEVKTHAESGARHFDQQYRIISKDGEALWVYDFTVVLRDDAGEITHYQGYVLNATDRRLAEEALGESAAKYEAVVRAFDGLLYICSQDFKIEFMNQRYIERTGYNAVGMDCYRALHNREDVCPWCVHDTVFRGKTVRWEVLSPKDNRWYYIVNSPLQHPDGRVSKMAMMQDITERKQTEEMLRRRDAILEAVGFASEQFMKDASWERSIHNVLARLGQAVSAGRAHISQVVESAGGRLVASRRFEWAATGVITQIYNPELQNFDLSDKGFKRWIDSLSRGKIIDGNIREFPELERKTLARYDIKSIMVVPVFVKEAWWGFIGFDSCDGERNWSASEMDALKVAAGMLGAAIRRADFEDELRHSEGRNRVILNAIPDMMFRISKDGTFLDFKAERDSDLLTPAEQFIGRKLKDILPPDLADLSMRHLAAALSSGSKQVYEYDMVIDGELRYFESRMVVSGKNEVLCIIRNITRDKQAQEALRRSEEKYRNLVENMHDWVWEMDSSEVFTYCSPSCKLMLGYDPGEMLGRSAASFLTSEEHIRMQRVFSGIMMRQGQSCLYEGSWIGKDSRSIIVESSVVPVFDPRGSLSGYRGICRDVTDRKKTEAELTKLHRAVSQTADSVVITDRTGIVEYVNPAFERMTGYSSEEVIGRKLSLLKSDRHDRGFYQRLWDSLAAGEVVQREFINKRKNGELYCQSQTISPVRDEQGNITHFVSSSRDSTERVAAEEALRDSAQRLADIINSLPDPTFAIDGNGRVIAWNRAIETMTGVKASDILGKGNYEYAVPFYGAKRPVLADLVMNPDEECERLYKYVQRDRDTLVAEVFLPALKPGGLLALVSATTLYDNRGQLVGAIESIRDITARKRAEEDIRKLAAFPQHNPNPIFEFSSTGEITYFNDAAREMIASLGKSEPAEILPTDTASIVTECLISNQSRRRVEVPVGRRRLSWSFFPVIDSRLVHAYGVDITERLNLESQMRHLQKMEAVGRMAGGVAHDFNNILTAISGYTSMLLAEPALPPLMEEQVREIARAADRASNLTRQLLAFSRKQVMQQKIVNLNEVLDNLAAMLRRLISEDIVLEIKCEPELPCVSADPAMIEQCLVNLVINARDAIGRDGCILIATSTRSITDVTLSDNPEARNGRFVCLTVTDTGCGMNEDVRNRLFEPFFTTKESGHGTGLGLATAYGIVKQHDGWIDVISEESHGSTFHIYLPINSGRPKPAVARMTKRVAGGTETILVVEDEPSVRSLACSILKQYGYNVLEAASGQEAMAVWAAHKGDIHLLLSDVIMPGGMTGGELAERLLKSRPDLHVVFTSGYSLEAVHDKVARVTHFLPKPFTPDDLARKVRNCLDGIEPEKA